MAARKKSRRPSKAPSRSTSRSSSPGPIVWLGAGAAAWIVWNLTQPGTASAAEGTPGQSGQPGLPPSALPTSPPSSLLRRGSKGPDVKAWQSTLIFGGYLPDAPSSRDSAFGPLTEAATKVFQKKSGLAEDGVVGPKTRSAAANLQAMIPGA